MAEIFEKDEYEFPGDNPSRNQLQKTALFAIYDALTYLDMKEAVPMEEIGTRVFEVMNPSASIGQ